MPLNETLRYLVTADSSGMVKELGKAQRSLKETGDSAEKTANRNQKASRETVQAWEKTSSRMMSVGKTLAGGLAGLAVFSFVKDAANEAREAAQLQRETAQVIKTTGGAANIASADVSKLADRFARLAAVDDEVVQGGANLLLTFTNVRNEMGKGNRIFDETLRLSVDFAARFRKDLNPSIIMVGKALNDPIKGLTALGRAGVQFTAEQKTLIKTLVESGQTLEAQKLILAELEKQVGGAAAAMADPMARFGVAVDDAKEAVGEALLPVLEDFANLAADAAEWFGELDITTRKWVVGVGLGVLGLGALSKVLSPAIGLYRSLAAAATAAAAAQTAAAATGGAPSAAGAAAAPVAVPIAGRGIAALGGIGPAAGAAAGAIKIVTDGMTAFKDATDESTSFFEDAWGRLQMMPITNPFSVPLQAAKTAFDQLTGSSKELRAELANEALDEIAGNVAELRTQFAATTDPVAAAALAMGQVNDELDPMSEFAAQAAEEINNFFAPFLGEEQAFNNFEQQLLGITTQLGVLTDGVPDTAEALLQVGNSALNGAESFATLATKILEAGGTAETVEGAKQRMVQSLTELGAHADGPTKEQIQRTIDKLNEFDATNAVATISVEDNASPYIRNITSALNDMFSKVGLPKPEFITRALGLGGERLFAMGGQLPTYSMGTGGGMVDQMTAVVGEGDAPEYVIPTDSKYRTRAISLMTQASRAIGISGLASGGVIDPVVDALVADGGNAAKQIADRLFEKVKSLGGGKGRVAADFARQQVGKPYVWGATGPNAYDCSGLTSAAWRAAGVSIPRVSHAQIAAARALTMGEATQMPGSLFYTTSSGSPSGGHIAISHGDGSLTNARGRATGVTITGPFGGRQGIPSFDRGGTLHPGLNVVHNGTGGPERLNREPGVTVQIVNNGSIGVDDIVERVHRGLLDKQRRVGALGLR